MIHRLALLLVLAPSLIACLAAAALAEDCFTYGGTQFYESMHVCVSSSLEAYGAISYGPANLGDGVSATAWCEPPDSPEQWVEVRWPWAQHFQTLWLRNGYAKSETAYRANSRPRRIRITTDDGLSAETELLDQASEQPVHLPRVVDASVIRITILSTYPGDTYFDMCMNELHVDLEELNY